MPQTRSIKLLNVTIPECDVDAALNRLERPIGKYCQIQKEFIRLEGKVSENSDFKKLFNGFYRVRRSREWQGHFYGLMERTKKKSKASFEEVLNELKSKTHRYEASFASKLIATIDTNMPVIDQHVLRNMQLKMPAYNHPDRGRKIVEVYKELIKKYGQLMKSGGAFICKKFDAVHNLKPSTPISDLKKVDLVLWQLRVSRVKAKRTSSQKSRPPSRGGKNSLFPCVTLAPCRTTTPTTQSAVPWPSDTNEATAQSPEELI